MPVARQWTIVVGGSTAATVAAVRRAVTSSSRWTMAAESDLKLVVVHQPPRWLLMLPTAIRVEVSEAGADQSRVDLRVDTQQLVSGDVFQLYLDELQMLASAIAYEASGAASAPRPVATAVSAREITLLVLLVIAVVGGVLVWLTDNWLCLLAFLPLVVFAIYATVTKPSPPQVASRGAPSV